MLGEEIRPAGPQKRAQDESDEDRVVELAGDRDEVGDEVERHREVGNQRVNEQAPPPGHARVAHEPAEEDDAVGDEAGERAGILAPPAEDQRAHADGVERERNPERDREPEPGAQGESRSTTQRSPSRR